MTLPHLTGSSSNLIASSKPPVVNVIVDSDGIRKVITPITNAIS